MRKLRVLFQFLRNYA